MGIRFQILPFNLLNQDEDFWAACRTIRQFVPGAVRDVIRPRAARNLEEGMRSDVLVDNLITESRDKKEVLDALINDFLPG